MTEDVDTDSEDRDYDALRYYGLPRVTPLRPAGPPRDLSQAGA